MDRNLILILVALVCATGVTCVWVLTGHNDTTLAAYFAFVFTLVGWFGKSVHQTIKRDKKP